MGWAEQSQSFLLLILFSFLFFSLDFPIVVLLGVFLPFFFVLRMPPLSMSSRSASTKKSFTSLTLTRTIVESSRGVQKENEKHDRSQNAQVSKKKKKKEKRKKRRQVPALPQTLASLFRKLSQGCPPFPRLGSRPNLCSEEEWLRRTRRGEELGLKPKAGKVRHWVCHRGQEAKAGNPVWFLVSVPLLFRLFFPSFFTSCLFFVFCIQNNSHHLTSNYTFTFPTSFFSSAALISFLSTAFTLFSLALLSLSLSFRLTTTATTSKTPHTYSRCNSPFISLYPNNNDQQHETTSTRYNILITPLSLLILLSYPRPPPLFFSPSPISLSLHPCPPLSHYSFFFFSHTCCFVTKWNERQKH